MRRIGAREFLHEIRMTLDGITSACEENTRHSRYAKPYPRNYPRARGEYNQVVGCLIYCWELPPRTRRIQPKVLDWPYEMGTTSAYAENTRMWGCLKKKSRNYLRVRGEYRPESRRGTLRGGTTSAYAENTIGSGRGSGRGRNYLRVRGEYLNELGLL